VTGPDVVRRVTGEDIDMERLGGPDTHGRISGVAHIVSPTDDGWATLPHAGKIGPQRGASSDHRRSWWDGQGGTVALGC